MERGGENGGSQQPSCLVDGLTLAFREMEETVIEQKLLSILPQLVKPMVTTTIQQEFVRVAEDLFRRVVQEEIQKFKEELLNGGTWSEGRILQIKFLDEVPNTVQTSEELRGIKGNCLEVALVDPADGQIVRCGPESSAKVEILLLDDNGKDNVTHENFERRIIREGDKEKPHFNQSVYVYLDKGVGSLSGVKLGQDSGWTKNYNCRLGARIVQIFKGIVVPEAWTAPFKVQDNRNAHAKKHCLPSLSSEVWRLAKIARRSKRCICLEEKNIKTLRDFLFWLNVKPDELKQILDLGDNRWNSTVSHARTCKIDDERMYSHESPTEPQIRVIYDVVGKLKGEIIWSHFVPIDKLTTDRKVRARELLSSVLEPSAFGERYDTSFSNEDSLLKEFPYRSSHTNASTNSSLQHGGVSASEDICGYRTTERGSSSQSIIFPNNLYNSGPSNSLGSREMGELCNPASGPFPDPQITGGGPLADLGTSDYEKHETPSLADEVSRLVNICKDGEVHKRLRGNKISTVEDFLIRLLIDHEWLKRVVNLEGHKWEATVNNAKACPTGSKMYCYTKLEEKTSVVFNVVGDVLGLCFKNNFVPACSSTEKIIKAIGKDLLACACRNWWSVTPVNDMNHLQQHLSSGTSEMVGSSPSNLMGESSRMISAGEDGALSQDLGSSYSVTDDMETMLEAEMPCNRTCQCECSCNLDIFFKDIEGEIQQRFPNVCVGSNGLKWKPNWKPLLWVIKWCFSSDTTRVPHHVTRERKRQRQQQ